MKKKPICHLPGCSSPVHYKQAQLCKACYSFLYYWHNRSVTDKMKHVHKVERWGERVSALVPEKITPMRRRA